MRPADYHLATMVDPAPTEGLLAELEAPASAPRQMPAFVTDLSGRRLTVRFESALNRHGSYLVRRQNVMLFGSNNLVTPSGQWSCEARTHKRQFLHYFHQDFYERDFPGARPRIGQIRDSLRLLTEHLTATDITYLDEPIFLATPLEPPIWGRWITAVLPKIRHYLAQGAAQAFFCHVEHNWQRAFLQFHGVPAAKILAHDPGRTYICRDVTTVEFSETNFALSAAERAHTLGLADRFRGKIPSPPNIYVARLARSAKNPHYRVLRNEAELAVALQKLGFAVIEPEFMSFAAQIALFAGAKNLVCLGGSAIFNAAFCAAGTKIIDIESSDTYTRDHARFFASAGLECGVVFGAEDLDSPSPAHKNWTVDVSKVVGIVKRFMS